MKSKSHPAAQLKRAPTQNQLQAMRLGATPAEVALVRQSSGGRHAAAMAIAAMKIRMEEGAPT